MVQNVSFSNLRLDEIDLILEENKLEKFESIRCSKAIKHICAYPEKGNSLAGMAKRLVAEFSESESLLIFYDVDIFESSSLLNAYNFLRDLSPEELSQFPGILVNKNRMGFLEAVLSIGMISAWEMILLKIETRELLFFSNDEWMGGNLKDSTLQKIL